jgi:hypothetical protein
MKRFKKKDFFTTEHDQGQKKPRARGKELGTLGAMHGSGRSELRAWTRGKLFCYLLQAVSLK